MITNPGKDTKQLNFLYDWMRIARKPNQSLRQDVKMLFQLINIPITHSELDIIQQSINPQANKTELNRQDLLACFSVDQDQRKSKEKQLVKAFAYITNHHNTISFQQLKSHFHAQDIDNPITDLIIQQLCQFQHSNGQFDYQKFANSIY